MSSPSPSPSIFTTSKPYHIFSYSTLLGINLYQSFISGPIAYKALSRPSFSQLQQAVFPIYFSLQTGLSVLLALTYPGLIANLTNGTTTNLLSPSNRTHTLLPMGIIFASSLSNLLFAGPQTTKIMRERKVQETRDGKKSSDPPPHSRAMQSLNKQFARMHGASSLLNLGAFVATVWYGFTLAERFE
ncbi:hypothetical protein MMC20_000621 [Loxospora ochrophaea]|nr:hypothetical protein [Loxospora ochrophaea]